MRVKNLILSAFLIAITTSAFGQSPSIRERVFHSRSDEVPFKTAEYHIKTGQVRALLQQLFTRNIEEAISYESAEPVVLACYTVDRIEISYQAELGTEQWMTEPFQTSEEVVMERWMTEPFENIEEVIMEGWMAEPFVAHELMVLEHWMAESWN